MNLTSSGIDERRGKYVPWVIVAFYVSFIIPLLFFVWIAFTHKPSEVTVHAYDKGLAYNRTLEKAAAQQTLDWKTEITLEDNVLRFTLKDAHGMPIGGARVDGWLVRPSQQTLDQPIALKETAKGVYEGKAELPAKGLWEVRVTALSQGEQFQAAKTLTVE